MATTTTEISAERIAQVQIEDMLTKLSELWGRHDIAGYTSHFSEGVDFVNVLGGHTRGRVAIQAELVAIHQTIFRNSRLKIIDRSLRFLTPEIAIVHVDWQMTGHDNPLEKQWQSVREGIFTAVFVAEGPTWKITVFHNTDKVPAQAKQ